MGLFIHLYVNPTNIEPEQWQATFDDSLIILEKFPVPLMRFTSEERLGKKRLLYTSNIVEDKGAEAENWQICGDMESRQTGESARLHRNLSYWFKNYQPKWQDKDILWADEDKIDYVNCHGRDAFGNKTQGHPFHLALLAVTILFESRFPKSVCLIGDIDREQVEQMMNWLKEELNMDVTKPICMDGAGLYQRLSELYEAPVLAVQRFKALSRDADEDQLQLLLAHAPREAVMDDFKQELTHYQSLNQIGSADLVAQFLGATKNLEQLIELVLEISSTKDNQDEFNLKALLKLLGRRFVTIDFPERKALSLFAHSTDALMTIEDLFSQVFMRLGGMPSSIDYYCEAERLVEIFSTYEPHHREQFQQILETAEQGCWDSLQEIEALINKTDQTSSTKQLVDKTPTVQINPEPSTNEADLPDEYLSPANEYILNQVKWQKKGFKNPEESAKAMSESLQYVLNENPDLFVDKDKEFYLQQIYFGSGKHGIVLRETAWQAIDNLADIEILKCLAALALITHREISFCRWRVYFLEHPLLWPYLKPHGD